MEKTSLLFYTLCIFALITIFINWGLHNAYAQ